MVDLYTLRDFDIHIELEPGALFLGTRDGTTDSGIVTFQSLLIKEEGIFKVKATGTDVYSNYSDSFHVINTEAVDRIKLNSTEKSYRTGDYFMVNCYLFNYSGLAFLNKSNVVLYTFAQDFNGDYQLTANNGTVSFNVSVSDIGKIEFKAYSSNDTKDPTVETLKVNIYDKLCKDLDEDYYCKACVSLAEFDDNGICKCKANTYEYNYACLCIKGYHLKDGSCVPCGNHFLTKDLSGSIQDDLKTIKIDFGRQVNTSLYEDCLKVLLLPSSLSSYKLVCTWLSQFSLSLTSDSYIPNLSFSISLLPALVPSTPVCVIYSEAEIQVSPCKLKPLPSIQLLAADSYSIRCSTTNLLLSLQPVKNEYSISWTVILNTFNLIEIRDQPSITIEKSYLKAGQLLVKVNISSILASKPVSLEKLIELNDDVVLDLKLSLPYYNQVYRSDGISIKASTYDTCSTSTSQLEYTWKYVSSFDLDFASILASNSLQDSLAFSASLLEVGNTYSFQVTVKKNNLQASQVISFEVKPQDLVISFDTWGGVTGTKQNLQVNSVVSDPDEQGASIVYEWTCTQGSQSCYDHGVNIINNPASSSLTVNSSHLHHGSTYTFKLTVVNGFKKASKEIEFIANKNFKADIQMASLPSSSPAGSPMLILPNITTSATLSFRWSFSPQLRDPWSYDSKNLYVSIPQNTLTPGITYKLTLYIKDSSLEKFGFSTFIKCPAGPSCSSFDSYEEGKYCVMKINNCKSDFGLLTYQFGVIYNTTIYDKMTLKITSPEAKFIVKNDSTKAFVEVCDSITCETFVTLIQRNSRRQLDTLEDAEDFIKNPEDVLQAIYLYGDSLNSTQYEFLYQKFLEFFSNAHLDQGLFYLYLEKMNVVLSRSDSISKYVFRDIINVFAQEYEDKQYYLSPEQMNTLLNSIDAYVIQNSTIYNLKLLDRLAKIYLNNSFPTSSEIIHSDGYFFYIQRMTGKQLSGIVLRFDGWAITMPKNKTVDPNTIYDLIITKLNSTDEVISIKVYKVGYLQGYNLVFTDREEDQLNVNSSGTVSLFYEIDSGYHYKCKILDYEEEKWTTTGCSIETLDSDLTETKFDNICTMKLARVSKKCPFNFYPNVALGALILIFSYLFFVINRNDQVRRGFLKPKTYLTMHPIISLLFVQRYRVRVNTLMQILTNLLLLFALIGFMHNYFAFPLKASYDNYEKFLDYHAEIGAIGFAISQAFILPCFALNTFLYVDNKYFWYMNAARAAVALPSIGGIIAMSIIYCGQFTYRWLINFVIFCPAQLIFLEGIYAFLFEMCIGEDQSRFKRVSTIKFFNGSDSEENDSMNERQAGYLFKVYKANKVVPVSESQQ